MEKLKDVRVLITFLIILVFIDLYQVSKEKIIVKDPPIKLYSRFQIHVSVLIRIVNANGSEKYGGFLRLLRTLLSLSFKIDVGLESVKFYVSLISCLCFYTKL